MKGMGRQIIPAGDRVVIDMPEAARYGDPAERDIERVREDVRSEVVSREAAERDYGVVITEPCPEAPGRGCEVLGGQLELRRQTLDRLLQPRQREAERLRLVRVSDPAFHPTMACFSNSLEKLHQGQHQPFADRALHVLRIRVPACRSELADAVLELLTQRLDLARVQRPRFPLAHVSSPDTNA